MATKSLNNKTNCPFWTPETKKCQVCNTGIFIPLEDHISVYCTTSNYIKCMQYGLNKDLEIENRMGGLRVGHNRRQHMRVESNLQLTLVKLIESEEVVNHTPLTVETLDISRGGMRITTNSPLNRNTRVQFIFEKNFPSPTHKAMAEVQWCNKQIDDPGYQVGVAFHDTDIGNAMEHYLGNRYGTT